MSSGGGGGISDSAFLWNAQKQYELGKQLQDRLDKLAIEQTGQFRSYRSLWENYYQGCEQNKITELCARPKELANYSSAMNRSMAAVRRQVGLTRDKLRRCAPLHCVGQNLRDLRILALFEAQLSVDATEKAYRYAEERARVLNAYTEELLYRQLALGRGLISQANAAAALAGKLLDSSATQRGAAAGAGLAGLQGLISLGAPIAKAAWDAASSAWSGSATTAANLGVSSVENVASNAITYSVSAAAANAADAAPTLSATGAGLDAATLGWTADTAVIATATADAALAVDAADVASLLALAI